jgi:hypothetical protein
VSVLWQDTSLVRSEVPVSGTTGGRQASAAAQAEAGEVVTTRRVPGLVWLRLDRHLTPTDIRRGASGYIEPGHGWLYAGLIRRDTFTVAGRGLVVMFMPKRTTKASKAYLQSKEAL